jgi:hypothetical protein
VSGQTHRPRGLPRAAVPAFVSLYLLLGAVPAIVTMMAGYFMGSATDPLMNNFLIYLGVISVLMLTTIIGLSRGDLWGIRLFRLLAWCLLAMVIVGVIAAALLAAGMIGKGLIGARGTGEFGLVALVAACAPAWIMLHGLWHVSWLNPNSRPDEWEPPYQ